MKKLFIGGISNSLDVKNQLVKYCQETYPNLEVIDVGPEKAGGVGNLLNPVKHMELAAKSAIQEDALAVLICNTGTSAGAAARIAGSSFVHQKEIGSSERMKQEKILCTGHTFGLSEIKKGVDALIQAHQA